MSSLETFLSKTYSQNTAELFKKMKQAMKITVEFQKFLTEKNIESILTNYGYLRVKLMPLPDDKWMYISIRVIHYSNIETFLVINDEMYTDSHIGYESVRKFGSFNDVFCEIERLMNIYDDNN